ncbi:Hypothetical protein CINCED_3A004777 [Cinara cedri]|uniref:5'-nucleotidase n=1 Tax=Cinara cedri TaxID=506608 RepID=A0A5E4MB06_9HEMI|nr:Hypothetical protein CINCED_3A004777 [Cinara cedri]
MAATMRMGRGNYWRGCGLLTLCLIMATALPRVVADPDDDDVYRLVLLHTNDMHSNFHQVDKYGTPCSAKSADVTKCYGGFARVKTAVDNERKNAENAVLYLDAGGSIRNTAPHTYFKTKSMADLMMKLKPDAMSLGSKEFKDGLVNIKNFIHDIKIPIVCSNIDVSEEPLLSTEKNLMKSKIIKIKGRKIGIIGYLTPETHNGASEYMGNVKIKPEKEEIQNEVNYLKSNGVNIIIALGHSGIETDEMIAMEVKDIDVVVGGYSCTFLYKGKMPNIDEPYDSYPVWVEPPSDSSIFWFFDYSIPKSVPIVQAFRDTKYLGKLVLEFDMDGNVTSAEGNPILLDYTIEQDPDLLKYLKEMEESIEKLTSSVIGSTSVVLQGSNRFCWTQECNLGNFVADAFVAHNVRTNMKSFDLTQQWTDASIAFLQSGVIRSNIGPTNPAGVITMGDILLVLPLLHDVGKVTVKGSEIRRIIEQTVQPSSEGNGEFLQMSGVKLVIDHKYRVKTIKVRCAICLVPVYKTLDPDADYTIIINENLVTGESDFKFNQLVTDYQSLGITETEILKREIEIKRLIRPEISGRIIIVTDSDKELMTDTESLEDEMGDVTETADDGELYDFGVESTVTLVGSFF